MNCERESILPPEDPYEQERRERDNRISQSIANQQAIKNYENAIYEARQWALGVSGYSIHRTRTTLIGNYRATIYLSPGSYLFQKIPGSYKNL